MIYIGIDLGGTAVKIGAVSASGQVLGKAEKPTRAERPYGEVIRDMAEGIREILGQLNLPEDQIASIGVGVTGAVNNDPFYMEGDTVAKRTNHAGGILGGISDGSPIICRVYVKPTPSIFREQETVDESGNERTLLIKGRHDPVVVPRAVVVVECMCALTILDAMLANMTCRADAVKAFYNIRKQ